jgi:long-chain acyl-CoA synthetase
VLVSGGAPLSVEVGQFFETLKLPVLEGYGLSESAPLLAVNPMHDRRIGTVGVAAKGVEIRIAEDGEIIARGGNIMSGYWKNRKATKEALIDGWLHTGDIGEFDGDGYLTITDRKKDIIVNSGGENIAPQRVEGLLIAEPLIEQVIVYGDQRPYLVAMVVPNQEACIAWAEETGMPKSGWSELAASDMLRKHIQGQIQQRLKPLNSHEQIRRIYIQTEPFTIENDFLTPTMKLKRRMIYQEFAEIFESLY